MHPPIFPTASRTFLSRPLAARLLSLLLGVLTSCAHALTGGASEPGQARKAQSLASPVSAEERPKATSFDQLGAEAQKQYDTDGSAITPTVGSLRSRTLVRFCACATSGVDTSYPSHTGFTTTSAFLPALTFPPSLSLHV